MATHEATRLGTHHHDVVDRWADGWFRPGQLLEQRGRPDRPGEDARHRRRPLQHHGEHDPGRAARHRSNQGPSPARPGRAHGQAHRDAAPGNAGGDRRSNRVSLFARGKLYHWCRASRDGRHGPLHLLMAGLLDVSTTDFVTTIRMNRPPVNALVAELQEELIAALNHVKEDAATPVAVRTRAIEPDFLP